MNWEPQPGTEAITGWINQGVLFALVLAVALVVGCAVLWAAGSMSANGSVVSRARTGIAVGLAAALLLGAGLTYLRWTSTTQAVAFAGDPKDYSIDDAPQLPGDWEFVDLSDRWTADINDVRAGDGLPPFTTDGALTQKAKSCAGSRAGLGGDCPTNQLSCADNTGLVFGAWEYGPGELDKLGGDLTAEFIRSPNPWGGISTPVTLDRSADMRSAWVAMRDNSNKRAVVVAMLENPAGLAVWNACTQFG
ncbi:DUF6112 family protein [Nakamurella multipartita]|uniref:Uncharacterized protein n=1 Tax=Nakamurella multipartita (strain ATCC 700099 / DSM 44233 / CIP 104796 / JCM 9543 / NBRC 105858 / Y-104) TaxID=479431 RepID=C8XHD6_NAKMY|nr:DUF6112 family protein [Nakamurella multipartita]ACV78342.1 hypothetical protein Namu_1953 [Nakamurella multipartita DSM 44233]